MKGGGGGGCGGGRGGNGGDGGVNVEVAGIYMCLGVGGLLH